MPKQQVDQRRLAAWLNEQMKSRRMDQKTLHFRANVSQSLISEVLNQKTNVGQETLARMIRALTPQDMTEAEVQAFYNEGMLAGGFAPDNEIIPEPILEELRGAAFAGELSEAAVIDIADYVKLKREQERRKKVG